MKPRDPFCTCPHPLILLPRLLTMLPIFFSGTYRHISFFCALLYCFGQRDGAVFTNLPPPAKRSLYCDTGLLWWSGTEPSISSRYACAFMSFNRMFIPLFFDFLSSEMIHWFPIMVSEDLASYTYCSHFLSSFY